MSLTAPGSKGVVTDFAVATPSATVAFQAVSAPVPYNIVFCVTDKTETSKKLTAYSCLSYVDKKLTDKNIC